MATSSTVPALKAAIVSALTALLPGVQVLYGRPADNQLKRECVFVADTRGQHRPANLRAGRKDREETYSIDVVAVVLSPRGTLQTAEARCFALLAKVEDIVADDPSVSNVDGVIHVTAGSFRAEPEFAAEGPVARIVLELDVLARIN